jgi:hypothetical protein
MLQPLFPLPQFQELDRLPWLRLPKIHVFIDKIFLF